MARPGETTQGGLLEGDTVRQLGGVPAQEEEEPEEVRRRWGAGGVPIVNCTWGGDREEMGQAMGGADTRRDLVLGNCFVGDLGDDTGLCPDMEEALGRRCIAGLGWTPPHEGRGSFSGTTSSPRVELPVELTPLIADTE